MSSGFQPLVGQKGKQYGLVLMKKPAAAQPKMKSVFNVEDDDEPAPVNQQLMSKAMQAKTAKLASEEHKKALELDPTIFDYDGVVDAIQEKRETKQLEKTQEQLRREPRYVKQLLERAKIKQLEDELVEERKLAKERAVDDHLYGDKEKFMTTAYKEKLALLNKFKADLAKREEEEKKNAVEGRGDLSGFYTHLLKDNENMGGGPRDFAGKKPEAPTKDKETAGGDAMVKKEKDVVVKKEEGSQHSERHDEPRRRESTGSRGGDVRSEEAEGRHGGDSDHSHSDSHQRKREYTPGGTEVPWKRFKNPLIEKKEKMAPKLLPRLDDKEIEAARKRYLKRKAERTA